MRNYDAERRARRERRAKAPEAQVPSHGGGVDGFIGGVIKVALFLGVLALLAYWPI